jgi:hypothetical protein
MIKFFRKIRQNLLIENKTGKYFKYAIGEIILVVIGILIAVQINSWYTTLKKNELKTTYTRNLINDLTKDTIQLNAGVKLNEDIFLKRIDSLKAIIANPNTTVGDIKTMGKNVGVGGLRTLNTYNNNTFNILISSGNIDLFDENVIQKIMELNRLQNVETGVANGNRESYFSIYTNYLQRYVNSRFETSEAINNEIWDNIDSKEHASIYINAINVQRHSVTRYIELTKNVLTTTEELIKILKSGTEVE